MAFKRSAVRSRLSPPNERYTNTSPYTSRFCLKEHEYTNTIFKASLAVYGTWFALIVKIDDYEGEVYPETKQPTYKEIRAWIKERYGFTVNSASISQTKKKYGLIADTEGRYVQKVRPEKEAAIREAFIRFGILKK